MDKKLTPKQTITVKNLLADKIREYRDFLAKNSNGKETQQEFLEKYSFWILEIHELSQIIYDWYGEIPNPALDQPDSEGWWAFEGAAWESQPIYVVDGIEYDEWQHEWTEEAEEHWQRYELELYPPHHYKKVLGTPFRKPLYVRPVRKGERYWDWSGSGSYDGPEGVLGYLETHHSWNDGMNGLNKLSGKWTRLYMPWEK